MNIQTITRLLAPSLVTLGCGSSAIDLDARTIEASSEPGVLAVVRERVEKIVVDDERLYWFGTRLRGAHILNSRFLRGCQKHDCASTLVTYDANTLDDPEGSGPANFFSVIDGQIYWYRSSSGDLVACPTAGCSGPPRKVASYAASDTVFDRDRIYSSEFGAPFSLSLTQPDPRQALPSPGIGVRTLAVHDAYVYWLTLSVTQGNSIVRTRTDESSAPETVTKDVRFSDFHDFSATAEPTAIYWTNNLLAGSINRCPLAGCSGASEVVVPRLRAPQKLLIDGSRLYYVHEPRPYGYSLSSCTIPACAEPVLLIEKLVAPGALALDDQYLYVATSEQDVSPYNFEQDIVARIRRLPKPDQELP